MKNILNATFAKIVVICLVVATAISCSIGDRAREDVQVVPEDAPLAEFIIGKWKSEHAVDEGGNESTYKYVLEFVDSNTVKFSHLTAEGYFLDGDTSQYSFLDSDTVFVDNRRIREGELWVLERDGQTLIVHRTVSNITVRFTFMRSTGR